MPRNDELVRAAGAGDLERLKRLIEGGADPNSVDEHGMGPLLTFHPEVTRYLLEHGANPDVQCNENIAPVLLGVSSHTECLRLMLEAGADPNRASNHNGETALHSAAGGGNADAVRLLLDHGANPNARTKPGMKTYALWRDAGAGRNATAPRGGVGQSRSHSGAIGRGWRSDNSRRQQGHPLELGQLASP